MFSDTIAFCETVLHTISLFFVQTVSKLGGRECRNVYTKLKEMFEYNLR